MPSNTPIKQRINSQRGMALIGVMILLMCIMSILLLGTINAASPNHSGTMSATNNATQSVFARMQSTTAFNLAESGISFTQAWLSYTTINTGPPSNASGFAPDFSAWGGTRTGQPARERITPDSSNPNAYFTVEIYPDASNRNNYQKKYLIESVGVTNGYQQIVQAYVTESSLSHYLVLLDQWNNANNFWVTGLTTFDGPVHDNNTGNSGVSNGQYENVLWSNAAGTPTMFTYQGSDAYTMSGGGVNWYLNSFNSPGAPQTASDWSHIAAGGQSDVQYNSSRIDFPTVNSAQLNAALGAVRAAPGLSQAAATGIVGTFVPNDGNINVAAGVNPNKFFSGTTEGGIYIHGNVDQMIFSVGSTNSAIQIVTVTQTDALNNKIVTTVRMDPTQGGAGKTTVAVSVNGINDPTQGGTVNGLTNGVIYSDGNIGSNGGGNPPQPNDGATKTGGVYGVIADNYVVSGQVQHTSSLTLATQADKDVMIDGSITYNTSRQIATDARGNPRYIDVNGAPTSSAALGTPVYVPESGDATFTTNAGTFGMVTRSALVTVNDYNNNPLNKFEMDGAVLATNLYDADHFDTRPTGLWENMGSYLSAVVGTFGMFGSDNLLTNGFNTQFNYDIRLTNSPPPYYPTTGSSYSLISWQRVGSTLQ